MDTLQELREMLAGLQAARDDVENRIASLSHVIEMVEDKRDRADKKARLPTNSQTLRDALHRRLTREGKPMRRQELYSYLVDAGITVNGNNPLNNMVAHMSNDDRFVSLGEGMWGIREFDEPAISPDESAPLAAGDRVWHPTFGQGVVMNCSPAAGDFIVTVAFKDQGVGVKRLSHSLAPLKKMAGHLSAP